MSPLQRIHATDTTARHGIHRHFTAGMGACVLYNGCSCIMHSTLRGVETSMLMATATVPKALHRGTRCPLQRIMGALATDMPDGELAALDVQDAAVVEVRREARRVQCSGHDDNLRRAPGILSTPCPLQHNTAPRGSR
jgi:hypothetical protein